MDFDQSPWGFVRKLVVVHEGADVVELGDIEVPKRRLPPETRGGDLGFDVADQPPDVEPEAYKLQVSHLEPGGPAIASGLQVGDVIVAVDGVDVRGERAYLAWTLLQVPQGAAVKLGLARGPTVSVTAGAPD
jgi:S1-C subfamily serine protease